jgi:uncharacterized protein (TIGR02588 family)
MDTNNQNKEEQNKGEKNFLEWTVFTVSLLLVLGILGYLGYKTFTHKTSPPEIEVVFRPNPSEATPYRYYVEIKNTGGATAEEVSIELVLEKDQETIEDAELTLAFVPQKSKRVGWLNFSKNPQMADTIFARVISFKKP